MKEEQSSRISDKNEEITRELGKIEQKNERAGKKTSRKRRKILSLSSIFPRDMGGSFTEVLSPETGLTNGCMEEKRLTLLQLKYFFNLLNDFYWREEEGSNCCQWEWVECNIRTGRVITLSLNKTLWLEGELLNASLFLPFKELRSLYLYGNHLAGCVENEDFKWLSRLSVLETLDLSFNNLENSILPHLYCLSALRTLNLASSNLEGTFQIQGDGRQLRLMNLSYNFLNKSTLAHLSGFPNLKSLSIRGNKLKGSIDIEGTKN
ncbi:hypothetical protein PTKIN_Ptkin09bG0272800 [Pterospermum kingtungense]